MTGMPEALARQLAELESASPAELRAQWERAYRHPAPKRASRDLLLRAVAYHIQERAEGGLSKAALKHLAHLADPKCNDGRPPRPAPPRLRPGTKQALLIDLLKRKKGATMEEIVEAIGWQAHSVRGAISGALKKRLGLAVTSEKVQARGRVYRIVGSR